MDSVRILIVEEQGDTANVLKAGLQNLNPDFEIKHVTSAEEALRTLGSGPFHLLISDLELPGLSGLELMAQFKYYSPISKVILLCGAEDMHSRRAVAQAGAEAFFFKPVDLADLTQSVQRVLSMSDDTPQVGLDITDTAMQGAAKQGHAIAKEIADLRDALKALSVVLISERGQVMARAGQLPDHEIETHLMPDLMTSFFASLRVGAFVNSDRPDNLQCFRGQDYHLHLMSINSSYGLLVVTRPQNSDKLSRLVDKSQISMARLSDLLAEFELPYEPSMELFRDIRFGTEKAEDSRLDEKLDELLNDAQTKPISHRKAEKYWKSASQEIMIHPARGGALTYEQARRLGLTPSD